MKVLMAFLDVINGKKLSTGSIMILAVFVMKQIGVGESEATEIAQNILLATGSVMAAWGYAHKWVKSRKK